MRSGHTRLGIATGILLCLSLMPARIADGIGSWLQSVVASMLSPATRPLVSLSASWNRGPDAAPAGPDADLLAQRLQLTETQLFNLRLRFDRLQTQNAELQNLRDWTGNNSRNMHADVIARTGRHPAPSVTVNVGTAHGVRVGDAVVSSAYLLGRVVSVERYTATVRPITAPGTMLESVLLPADVLPDASHVEGLRPFLLVADADGALVDDDVDVRVPIDTGHVAYLLERSGMAQWPPQVQGWLIGRVVSAVPTPGDPLRRRVVVEPHMSLDGQDALTIITSAAGPDPLAVQASGGPSP